MHAQRAHPVARRQPLHVRKVLRLRRLSGAEGLRLWHAGAHNRHTNGRTKTRCSSAQTMKYGPGRQRQSSSRCHRVSTRCTGAPHSWQGGEARAMRSALSMSLRAWAVLPYASPCTSRPATARGRGGFSRSDRPPRCGECRHRARFAQSTVCLDRTGPWFWQDTRIWACGGSACGTIGTLRPPLV
jgi:hypothetical protein